MPRKLVRCTTAAVLAAVVVAPAARADDGLPGVSAPSEPGLAPPTPSAVAASLTAPLADTAPAPIVAPSATVERAPQAAQAAVERMTDTVQAAAGRASDGPSDAVAEPPADRPHTALAGPASSRPGERASSVGRPPRTSRAGRPRADDERPILDVSSPRSTAVPQVDDEARGAAAGGVGPAAPASPSAPGDSGRLGLGPEPGSGGALLLLLLGLLVWAAEPYQPGLGRRLRLVIAEPRSYPFRLSLERPD